MKLQDALFNWLQIKTVSEARQGDTAAEETLDFFELVLREDHHVTHFEITQTDETMIHIRYEIDGKSKTQMFQRESVEKLLEDIKSNPKYNNQ